MVATAWPVRWVVGNGIAGSGYAAGPRAASAVLIVAAAPRADALVEVEVAGVAGTGGVGGAVTEDARATAWVQTVARYMRRHIPAPQISVACMHKASGPASPPSRAMARGKPS